MLLRLFNINLDYGLFNALKKVDFSLKASEVHAIVGEHGAGKSSLGFILSGVLQPDSGTIMIDEKPYRLFTLKIARRLGIEMVHQHMLSLNERVTVAENFLLATASCHQLLRKRKMIDAAYAFLDEYEIDLDPQIPVKNLNLPDRVFVDILKHLYARPKLLILDEALEKLSSDALKKILDILTVCKKAGMSILFITHRIDDIYHFADRVSILKHGEILLTDEVRNIDKLNLIKMAYTQLSTDSQPGNLDREFYQLIKYNEAILQHLPVNLMITDNENRIKMVNDYCKQTFRLQKPSYFNVPLDQLVSSSNEEILRLTQDSGSSRDEHTFYHVPITFNAIPLTCHLKSFPIYDGAVLIGNIIILEDMTEHDRLQKQVMLSEKLASVGLLAAGVAHEINNPLEIIYTYLNYVKHKFRAPEFHKVLDTLHEQISSIASIVSNLRSFSDSSTIADENFDLNHEIRNILTLIRHNASYKHITIHFEPYQGDLEIRANKHEINQVFLNLLKNSFEAMPCGGQIFIDTILIEKNGTNAVRIQVKDTGPGIGDENPNNIFLPFYSTKKGKQDNLGLGLSVSYGIIQKYHGTITAENIESGCQFVITLPQAV